MKIKYFQIPEPYYELLQNSNHIAKLFVSICQWQYGRIFFVAGFDTLRGGQAV